MPTIVFPRPADEVLDATSDEPFDRMAFVKHALDLVRPLRTTVAICSGARKMRVESGRAWGKGIGARWAMIAIPERASRRAIALAVAELCDTSVRPYVMDVLTTL